MSRLVVHMRALPPAFGRQPCAVAEILLRLEGVCLLTPPLSVSGPGARLWEQLVLPLRLGARDLLWSPLAAGPLMRPAQVVTVPDSCLHDPPLRLLRRARHVVAGSAQARGHLMAQAGLPGDRISVIAQGPHAADPAGSARIDWDAVAQAYAGLFRRLGANVALKPAPLAASPTDLPRRPVGKIGLNPLPVQ